MQKYIGIFSTFNGENGYGKIEFYYKLLASYANDLGLNLAFFSEEQIDWKNKKINGNIIKKGNIVKKRFDFPKVIYDRNFLKEDKINLVRKRLLKEGLSFFNDFDFLILANNKLKFDSFLQKYYKKNFLFKYPKALVFSEKSIFSFLQKYKKIVLKPVDGLQGKGIIFINQKDNKLFEIFGEDRFFGEKELLNYLRKKIEGDYLMQEMIEVKKFNNRYFDIRVLMQRDGHGELVFAGSVVRVAMPGEFCANLHKGAKAYPFDEIVKKIYPKKYIDLKINIEKASKQIFSLFEDKVPGDIGEMAIDFILNKEGEIYLLEVNSKPGRQAYLVLGEKKYRATISRVIDYCNYLLG